MLTLILVAITLAIPFLLITVSNISVLLAVYKSNRSMVERMGSLSDSGYAATALTSAVINIGDTKVGMDESVGNTSNNNSPSSSPVREIHRQMSSTNKNNNANKTAMVSSSDGSLIRAGTVIMSKKRRSVRRSRDKNSKITTMLLAISASFVLLNFPYFLAWCNYAYSRVVRQNIAFNTNRVLSQLNSTTTTISPYAIYLSNNATSEIIKPVTVVPTTTTSQANISFAFMRITEALNLLNYAINGFLYFSTGKLYREHLLFLLGCKYAKSNSF